MKNKEFTREQLLEMLTNLDNEEKNKENLRNKLNHLPSDMVNDLILNNRGNVKDCGSNIKLYIENHPDYKDNIKYNSLTYNIELNNQPFSEADLDRLTHCIEVDLGFYNKSKVADTVDVVAHLNEYNPIRNYIESNVWDGIPRVESLFIDKLGVEDNEINREMTRLWLIGAVKRIMQPGCKNEVMLVLVGPQGNGKTTIIERLFDKLGHDDNINIDNEQTFGQKLDRVSCVMFDELAGWNKKDSTEMKKWLSIRVDNFRKPYGRFAEQHKRHCVYCGTTNDKYFLKDYSDSCERRYWTMYCNSTKNMSWKMIDSLTDDFISQVWAEVYYMYLNNPDIAIDLSPKFYSELEVLQQQFKNSNEDHVGDMLTEILNRDYILNEDGMFIDNDDCINQVMHKDRNLKPGEHVGKIKIIKSSYIKNILKRVIGENRTHKYIYHLLKSSWRCHYCDNKIGTYCYKRLFDGMESTFYDYQ